MFRYVQDMAWSLRKFGGFQVMAEFLSFEAFSHGKNRQGCCRCCDLKPEP